METAARSMRRSPRTRKFPTLGQSRKMKQKSTRSEFNKFISSSGSEISSSSSQSFEDRTIRLECFGDCGSKMNNLLTTQTNLNIFTKYEKTPRQEDVERGRAPKDYYRVFGIEILKCQTEQKMEFEFEQKFVELFVDNMKRKSRTNMGLRKKKKQIKCH